MAHLELDKQGVDVLENEAMHSIGQSFGGDEKKLVKNFWKKNVRYINLNGLK